MRPMHGLMLWIRLESVGSSLKLFALALHTKHHVVQDRHLAPMLDCSHHHLIRQTQCLQTHSADMRPACTTNKGRLNVHAHQMVRA